MHLREQVWETRGRPWWKRGKCHFLRICANGSWRILRQMPWVECAAFSKYMPMRDQCANLKAFSSPQRTCLVVRGG